MNIIIIFFGCPLYQPKLFIFPWEVAWGKFLTLNNLQWRGWRLPNRCYLCGCEEETIYHVLLHCNIVSSLWEIIFTLVRGHWVFTKMVKEGIVNWRGAFVSKKRKKTWKSIPLEGEKPHSFQRWDSSRGYKILLFVIYGSGISCI